MSDHLSVDGVEIAASRLVELDGQGLDKVLFDEITAQLKAKAIKVKTGTLVDATNIASASEDDTDGHWVKHRAKTAAHRYKAHVGADADTALVEEVAVTPANINDGRAGPNALPDNPGDVYADSAYRGDHFGKAVLAKGGTPPIVATGMWGRDEAKIRARHEAHNQPIHCIRGRIEKIFGTWKRSYGLCRVRWRGMAKAALQIRLTAIALQHEAMLQHRGGRPIMGQAKAAMDENRRRPGNRQRSTVRKTLINRKTK